MIDLTCTCVDYSIVQNITMPESISETISLLLETQTMPKPFKNMRVIQRITDEFDIDDDIEFKKNNKKIKIKMNITRISNHISKLFFDDDMEE